MVILYKSVGLYKYYHRVEQLENGKLINGLCNELTTELLVEESYRNTLNKLILLFFF